MFILRKINRQIRNRIWSSVAQKWEGTTEKARRAESLIEKAIKKIMENEEVPSFCKSVIYGMAELLSCDSILTFWGPRQQQKHWSSSVLVSLGLTGRRTTSVTASQACWRYLYNYSVQWKKQTDVSDCSFKWLIRLLVYGEPLRDFQGTSIPLRTTFISNLMMLQH